LPGRDLLVAAGPADFAAAVCAAMDGAHAGMGAAARAVTLVPLDELFAPQHTT
jgi:alkyl hydroperoxide reductase subunit AhpF